MTFASAQPKTHSMPHSQGSYGIAVDNISVTYRNARLALYNTNCYVEPGTITGLVGPNGGGKSTLFKAGPLLGFLSPSQGRVHIDNLSIAQAQKQQLIAYVASSGRSGLELSRECVMTW